MSASKSKNSDFKLWLDSEIWLTDNHRGPRRDYITSLSEELEEWVKRYGYIMSKNWKPLVLAQWLYGVSVMEVVRTTPGGALNYPEPLHRNWQEDYDMFQSDLNFHEVSEFLERWNTTEDLEYDSPIGRRVHEELERLLYCYVDMDNCYRGRQLADRLLDTDSDTDSQGSRRRRGGTKRQEDIYIQESREGWHGGRGAKV